MGWLSKIFGGGSAKAPAKGASAEHKGYSVTAIPESANGQFRTAGEICSLNPEDTRVHRFIRADLHPSFEQACEHALHKGKQIVDERGDEVLKG